MEQLSDEFSFKPEEWQKVFNNMDTNEDGHISYNEFILACSTYTTKISEQQVQELFNQIDVNKDGFIDLGEMKNFFQEENVGESGASTTPEAQIWEPGA